MKDRETKLTRLHYMAWDERIPTIAWQTATGGGMIHNLTFSIDATSSCTQAVASVVYTSLITWTVSVQNALWPTTCVWITIVTLQANTGSYSLLLLTDCIRTTWRWVTWVSWTICYHWCHCCNGYEGYNLIGNKSKCVIYF
jgi:hypothetical protein